MNSREKGKRGERELARYLRSHGFEDARRGVQYNGADGSADVIGLPGWHVEVKRVEALNIEKALQQAERDAEGIAETPCVFHRRNGESWKVTIRARIFLALIKEIQRLQEEIEILIQEIGRRRKNENPARGD